MGRLGIFVLLTSAAFAAAQEAQPSAVAARGPAPAPAVDLALRERVTKFFQAYVDGKFRVAESYVAEDSKDYFYNLQKPRYLSFSIFKIVYAEDLNSATVTIRCQRTVESHVGKMTFDLDDPSEWKLEQGLWCWYVKKGMVDTPFGKVNQPLQGGAHPPSALPPIKAQVSDASQLPQLIKAEPGEVHLPPGGGSATIMVYNFRRELITLVFPKDTVPGLEITADHERIGGNFGAKVTFTYKPAPKAKTPADATVNLAFQSVKKPIPVKVFFDAPAQAAPAKEAAAPAKPAPTKK